MWQILLLVYKIEKTQILGATTYKILAGTIVILTQTWERDKELAAQMTLVLLPNSPRSITSYI